MTPTVMEWKRAVMSPRGPRPMTRLVLQAMAMRMGKDGRGCFLSARGLAKLTGLDKSVAAKYRREGVQGGWVIPPRRLNAPKAEWLPAIPEQVELSAPTGQLLSALRGRTVRSQRPNCPLSEVELSASALDSISFLSPFDFPIKASDSEAHDQEVKREGTIADLDLGSDAIRLCQRARPGADPLDLLRKFRLWGQGKPANDWQRSLQTFAINERLSDDEMRAEQRAIHNGSGPRLPGESVAEYQLRTADPPIAGTVLDAMRGLQR